MTGYRPAGKGVEAFLAVAIRSIEWRRETPASWLIEQMFESIRQ